MYRYDTSNQYSRIFSLRKIHPWTKYHGKLTWQSLFVGLLFCCYMFIDKTLESTTCTCVCNQILTWKVNSLITCQILKWWINQNNNFQVSRQVISHATSRHDSTLSRLLRTTAGDYYKHIHEYYTLAFQWY